MICNVERKNSSEHKPLHLTGSVSRRSAYFDEGFGPVQFTGFQCSGTETRLQDCMYTQENTCAHSSDAGVTCVGRSLSVVFCYT